MSVNALSLAFYGVMAFTPKPVCIPENSEVNTSAAMAVVFMMGFALHAINFIVAGFVEPSLRAVYFKGVRDEGLTAETRSLTYKIEIIETTFRLIFVGFSLFQISSLNTSAVRYCTEEQNVLGMEVEWTTNLALSQIAFVPIFYIWRFLV